MPKIDGMLAAGIWLPRRGTVSITRAPPAPQAPPPAPAPPATPPPPAPPASRLESASKPQLKTTADRGTSAPARVLVSLQRLPSNQMPMRSVSLIYFALPLALVLGSSCAPGAPASLSSSFGGGASANADANANMNANARAKAGQMQPLDLQIPLNSNDGRKSLAAHSLSSPLGTQLSQLFQRGQNALQTATRRAGDANASPGGVASAGSSDGANSRRDRWPLANRNRRQTRFQRLAQHLAERLGARNTIRVHNAFRDMLWTILSRLSMPTPVIYELRRMNLYSSQENALNDVLHDKNTTHTIRYKKLLRAVADAGVGKLAALAQLGKLADSATPSMASKWRAAASHRRRRSSDDSTLDNDDEDDDDDEAER